MSIAARYRSFLLDIDGVLVRGTEPIPGAADAIDRLRASGSGLAFLTNNSSRTPEQVVEILQAAGIAAEPEQVITSAVALGDVLVGRAGDTAYVIGEDGVRRALTDRGIEIVEGDPERADLVVVGFDRSVDYAKLRRASLLVERGAELMATNADSSFPAPDGLWPGAGAILAAITTTTGATPRVVGKPNRPMLEVATRAAGEGPVLVVGDRLDTDVAAAAAMGWDSALVLTGATKPQDLAHAEVLPTYVLQSIANLFDPAVRVREAQLVDREAVMGLVDAAGLVIPPGPRGNDTTLVAVDESERVVATGALERLGGALLARSLVRSVAVEKELQGHGIGTLLVATLAAWARRTGPGPAFLFTEGAQSFFERLGFRRIAWDDVPDPVASSPSVAACDAAWSVAMRLDL